MGLDPGSKRVGVAVSDDLGMTASALTTLIGHDQEGLIAEVARLAKEHRVQRIVVGLPMRMDGSLGPEAEQALALARDLEAELGLEVCDLGRALFQPGCGARPA